MEYLIEKGNHYANFTWNRLYPFTKGVISTRVIFDEDCLTVATPSGLNKLDGISGFNIHYNSGRLVWISNNNKIDIFGYVYNKGDRNNKFITSVDVNTIINYTIEYLNNEWVFIVNNKMITLDGTIPFIKFRCYPYFGGKAVAPCDIKINIE